MIGSASSHRLAHCVAVAVLPSRSSLSCCSLGVPRSVAVLRCLFWAVLVARFGMCGHRALIRPQHHECVSPAEPLSTEGTFWQQVHHFRSVTAKLALVGVLDNFA